MNPPVKVTDGVHRMGTRLVNWYVVEDGERLTVVDCGLPGYWSGAEEAIRALGRSFDDIDAIVLTHGDADHVGFGEELRKTTGVPVHVHAVDVEITTTDAEKEREKSIVPYLRHPVALGLMWEFGRNGGLKPPPIAEVTAYENGQTLGVPGSPQVVATPGHTNGHSALHFASHDVLFAGDALCTRNPLTGRMGPQLLPAAFNVSTDRAEESLAAVEATGARFVCPGHGDPWTDGAGSAVAAARAAGRT